MPTHVFQTVERPAPRFVLDTLKVRVGADLLDYSGDRLSRDINYALQRVLSDGARRRLRDQVAFRLSRLVLLRGRQSGSRVATDRFIDPSEIVDTVSDALKDASDDHGLSTEERRSHRRAHVLWAMARGVGETQADAAVLDNVDMTQFASAEAVQRWLQKHYASRLKGVIAARQPTHYSRRHVDREVDRWHPLRRDAAPEPETVVFLVRHNDPPDQAIVEQTVNPTRSLRFIERPFSADRLRGTVRNALTGREDHARQAEFVVQWILWCLAGQRTVRSADLTSQVTQCLRRVDDIAYLRWVTVVKNLDVEGIWQEADGLVTWPSPLLEFDPEAAQDPRRARHSLPDNGAPGLTG